MDGHLEKLNNTILVLVGILILDLSLGTSPAQANWSTPRKQVEISPLVQDKELKRIVKSDGSLKIWMTQEMECDSAGQKIAVVYESLGSGRVTHFTGTCKIKLRSNADACLGDESDAALKCYNEAIDHFGLQATHRKIPSADIKASETKTVPSGFPTSIKSNAPPTGGGVIR